MSTLLRMFPRWLGCAGATIVVATTAWTSLAPAGPAAASGPPAAPQIVAAAATGALGADDAIACPIPTGSEFDDSWGARRSGGRRHEGVDMIADRGTPIVAVQSGDVEFKRNRLGGNAVWLHSPSGNAFYYAHLDGFEGESRFALQGEVIGYVGSTGNAKGPHLHFETHFHGTVGNPYDATFAACVQPALDALQFLEAVEAERLAVHGTVTISRDPGTLDADLVAPDSLDAGTRDADTVAPAVIPAVGPSVTNLIEAIGAELLSADRVGGRDAVRIDVVSAP